MLRGRGKFQIANCALACAQHFSPFPIFMSDKSNSDTPVKYASNANETGLGEQENLLKPSTRINTIR
jgi:hypothetical protein